MNPSKALILETPLGKREIDHSGSPLGVVRMDASQSYQGMGELLSKYIDSSDQESWRRIKKKIDYTYEQIDFALAPLRAETGFGKKIQLQMAQGKKLLFKPNLVNPLCMDPQTHKPDWGSTACTEWSFLAALMRWFHDKLDIPYHRMALGEAATCMAAAAGYYSHIHPEKNTITPEAVIEGKVGDFYCGWGFFFARQYLAESPGLDPADDPMKGYAESLSGTYIPPGEASDRLMVYDLNRIFDDPAKGREVELSEGVNFDELVKSQKRVSSRAKRGDLIFASS
jgi:hypothetical protein